MYLSKHIIGITLFILLILTFIIFKLYAKKTYFNLNKQIRDTYKLLIYTLFKPTGLITLGLIGIWAATAFHHEKHLWVEILREASIFIFIAGLIGVSLHSKQFQQKFSELLYLNSDYLKHLSKEKKEAFFINTIKNAYEFSDYGIEEDFAQLTTQNYLPLFEEKHMTNHFMHRTFSPFRKNGDIKDGFWINEEQGWRAHYAKEKPSAISSNTRGVVFKDHNELFKQLNYSMELWVREAKRAEKISKTKVTEEHNRYIKTKIATRKDLSQSDFILSCQEIEQIKFSDKDTLINSLCDFFKDNKAKLGIEATFYIKNEKPTSVNKPEINIKDDGSIQLKYKVGGVEYLKIEINFLEQTLLFDIKAELPRLKEKTDYHFVQRSRFYSYYEEGFTLSCSAPTKNIILDIIFEDLPPNLKILPEVSYLALYGSNAMMKPIRSKSHYGAKFSGWFFVRHGLTFSYRIIAS